MASRVSVWSEISFTRHSYKPQRLRSPANIRADILALEREIEGVVAVMVGSNLVEGAAA